MSIQNRNITFTRSDLLWKLEFNVQLSTRRRTGQAFLISDRPLGTLPHFRLKAAVADHSLANHKIEFLTHSSKFLNPGRLLVTDAKIEECGGAMANAQPVTCQIRYTLDLSKLSAFESYARTWMVLIERYGGSHHGYFIPRASPDRIGVSFPGLGYDGPPDVAVAMFSFPDDESYRRYREMVATDPECQSAAALVRETRCFIRYERLFLEPVKRP